MPFILVLFAAVSAACSVISDATLTSENYAGTQLNAPAPDFRLTNQHGLSITLSDFRGKVVVLTFMESRCEDTCPLTALELLDAHQALDEQANKVVFIGVNVNVQANTVDDVAAATIKWRLNKISDWHFLTGEPAQLESIWQSYDIEVLPSAESEDLMHTPGVYLIDPVGQQRWYISTPFVEVGTPAPSVPLRDILILRIRQLLNERPS